MHLHTEENELKFQYAGELIIPLSYEMASNIRLISAGVVTGRLMGLDVSRASTPNT